MGACASKPVAKSDEQRLAAIKKRQAHLVKRWHKLCHMNQWINIQLQDVKQERHQVEQLIVKFQRAELELTEKKTKQPQQQHQQWNTESTVVAADGGDDN